MTPGRALRAGAALLVLAAGAGVLLFVAPFVLEYQPLGADWVTATRHHVVTGAVLVALLGSILLAVLSARLRALPGTRTAREPSQP